MAKRKYTRKQLIHLATQYGFHIWAILIIANAALVYAYHFATHAAGKNTVAQQVHTLDISQAPSPSLSPFLSPSDSPSTQQSPSPSTSPSPSPTAVPLGPTINLSFTIPGIGKGGVTKPLHPKRNITIFLFSPDVNSLDPAVKPLYTIQSTATFDDNPKSKTYMSYVNHSIDLGSDVKDGNYQIAFKTDQSLRTLIKENPSDLGGKSIGLSKGFGYDAPPQTVLMGDVVPDQGNNKIDINDYNAFINCYGSKSTSSFCKGHNYGDFNDDGVINGIDYNILLRSLNTLAQEGFAVPKLTPVPTGTFHVTKPTKKVTPTPAKKTKKVTPTAVPAKTASASKSGGSALGGILFILFLLILGAIGALLYFKNENIRNKINALIHLSPTGEPATGESPQKDTEQTAVDKTAKEQPTTETSAPTEKTPEKKAPVEKAAPAPSSGEVVEKDYYIKSKKPDETGKGVWLSLTDDNGPLEAHYAKSDVKEGFATIKGTMKTEKGKTYLEITELSSEG